MSLSSYIATSSRTHPRVDALVCTDMGGCMDNVRLSGASLKSVFEKQTGAAKVSHTRVWRELL